jgi:predicted transcriptional regulator
MTPRKKTAIEKPLTEVELELMTAIWRIGECTVRDVMEALPKERELAYTSVATMMKILETKGVLRSVKTDRAHLYRPMLSRADYEALSLRHLTENVFQGDPSSMVMRLLEDSKLSVEELRAIRKMLDERMG